MTNIREVTDPLENLLEILVSRKWLVSTGFFIVFAFAILGSIMMPTSYDAYTSIIVSRPTISRLGLPLSEEVSGPTFLNNQVALIQSRVTLERVVYRLDLHNANTRKTFFSKTKDRVYSALGIKKARPDPVEEAIERLRNMISVKLPRGTNIVMISVKAQSADFAALCANTLAAVYTDYAKELLSASAQSGFNLLEDQFQKTQEQLDAAQSRLDEYKKQEMSFIMSAEGAVIAEKLMNLEEERSEIQARINSLNSELSGVDDRDTGELAVLKEQLKKLNDTLSNALVFLKEDHPDVRLIRNQISQIENQIKESAVKGSEGSVGSDQSDIISKEIEELESRKKYIADQIQKISARRQELAEKEVSQQLLEREVEKYRQNAESVKAVVEQARAIRASALIQDSIKIVDKAFPPPFASKKSRIILLAVGGVFAFIFGIGMAFIAEYFDESLKTEEETEDYLAIPVIGVVPRIKGRKAVRISPLGMFAKE